jgi:hypothetical protein
MNRVGGSDVSVEAHGLPEPPSRQTMGLTFHDYAAGIASGQRVNRSDWPDLRDRHLPGAASAR